MTRYYIIQLLSGRELEITATELEGSELDRYVNEVCFHAGADHTEVELVEISLAEYMEQI